MPVDNRQQPDIHESAFAFALVLVSTRHYGFHEHSPSASLAQFSIGLERRWKGFWDLDKDYLPTLWTQKSSATKGLILSI